jgi:predicted nucleotidyltransferase
VNALEILLRQVSDLFDRHKRSWALVGGLAVSVRTEPRFTRDLDVAVAVSDDTDAEAFVRVLQISGFHAQTVLEQDATHRLATVRLVPTRMVAPGLMLDLLLASSGIETEICASAEPLAVFPDVVVPVARVHHLIALKVLARDDRSRPQDAADLRQLIRTCQEGDLALAGESVRLIERRGFNRARDLTGALTKAWTEFRST